MYIETRQPYINCKIYGPYTGKDNRLRLFIKMQDNSYKTISYPKFIMEIYLGKFLNKNETIHHKDYNPNNITEIKKAEMMEWDTYVA